LVALFFVNSAIFARATIKLADQAIEADAGRLPVEDVVREMAASSRAIILFVINATIFALIILDMVLKPF
jgi:hypothetical protein